MNPGDIIPQASSFANFKIIAAGFNIIKLEGFKLNYKADSAINYGKDGEAVSWTIKKYTRESSLTLLVEELKNLMSLVPGGDLLKLPPFPISAETSVPGVGTLKLEIPAVKIVGFPLEFKENDEKTSVQLDLLVVSYPIISFT